MSLTPEEKALARKYMDPTLTAGAGGKSTLMKESLKKDPEFIRLTEERAKRKREEQAKETPKSTRHNQFIEQHDPNKADKPKPKPKSTHKPKPSGVSDTSTQPPVKLDFLQDQMRNREKDFSARLGNITSEGRRKLAEAGIGTGYTSGGNMQNAISNALNQTHSIIGGAGKGRLGKLEDRLAKRQEGVENRVGGRILKRQARDKRQGTRAAAKELKNLSMAVPAQKLDTIQKDSGPTPGPSFGASSGGGGKGITSINTGPSRKGGNIPTSTKPRSTVSGVPTKEAALLSSTLSGGGMSLPGGKSKPSTLPHKEAALVSSVISGGGASLPGGRSTSNTLTSSTEKFKNRTTVKPGKDKKTKRKLDRTKGLTEQATSKYKNEVKVKGLTEQPSLRESSGNSPFSYSKKDNRKRNKKYKK